MTISKKTALLGVNDLKIFPITKDDSTAFTTGNAIDVPGIRQISITFDIKCKVFKYWKKKMKEFWSFFEKK